MQKIEIRTVKYWRLIDTYDSNIEKVHKCRPLIASFPVPFGHHDSVLNAAIGGSPFCPPLVPLLAIFWIFASNLLLLNWRIHTDLQRIPEAGRTTAATVACSKQVNFWRERIVYGEKIVFMAENSVLWR